MRVACLVAVLALASADAALAHAALVKSEPARRATLSKSPPQLRLWFNERLEPEYAMVSVIREGAGPVLTPKARVDKDDPKLLMLELPVLSSGVYTVKYRVLSVDGHTVDYGFTFSVKAEGAGK
ncbi:copper resistance CopC family protein [Rhodoferax sp.]|uniref:copper resistance CopC family protein n=1 Tax=Rhodoferax sp. TaxID=50421 RepID=UPI003BB541EB